MQYPQETSTVDQGHGLQAGVPAKPERLVSLDVFRGVTIAGMILVNNPGRWGGQYAPLKHADWNGWTPTDLVFPFFLFIVGVAMAFSFRRRLEQGHGLARLLAQVIRRTIILFALGLIMYGFRDFLNPLLSGQFPGLRLIGPYVLVIIGLALVFADKPLWSLGPTAGTRVRKLTGTAALALAILVFVLNFDYFQEKALRVPGVLQRIAVCYFFVSIIVMCVGVRGQVLVTAAILVGYWLIVKYVPPPGDYTASFTGRPEGLLHDWLDIKLLGNHLYSERPDPEGALSTLPAVATVLLGVLTGRWLQSSREKRDKTIGLFFAANVALLVGLCMNYEFAINKKIWSSSYVVFTAGLALHFLAMCYWLIDVKGHKLWSWPFVVFGTNAIVAFFASSLTAVTLARIRWATADGGMTSLKGWLYQNGFVSWAGELNGSLFYALAYITLWCVLLIPLYRKRIFVKV